MKQKESPMHFKITAPNPKDSMLLFKHNVLIDVMLSIRCLPLMNPMRTRDTYDAIIDFIEELITTDHEMHSDRVQIETKRRKMFTSKLREVK